MGNNVIEKVNMALQYKGLIPEIDMTLNNGHWLHANEGDILYDV